MRAFPRHAFSLDSATTPAASRPCPLRSMSSCSLGLTPNLPPAPLRYSYVALARRLGNFAFYAYRAPICLSISRAPFDHLPFVTTSCVLCERIHVNRRTWLYPLSLPLFARVDEAAASAAVFLIFHGAPRHRRKNWRFDPPPSFSDSVIPRRQPMTNKYH